MSGHSVTLRHCNITSLKLRGFGKEFVELSRPENYTAGSAIDDDDRRPTITKEKLNSVLVWAWLPFAVVVATPIALCLRVKVKVKWQELAGSTFPRPETTRTKAMFVKTNHKTEHC